jgi:hypothetical protein
MQRLKGLPWIAGAVLLAACGGASFTTGGEGADGGASSGGSSGGSSGNANGSSGSSGGASTSTGSSSSSGTTGTSSGMNSSTSSGGSSSGDSGVSSGGGSGDGGGASEGGAGDPCGTSPPTQGKCAPNGLVCEYGLGAVASCDTLATCTGGLWGVSPPVSCVSSEACPSTEPADQSTCATYVNGTICDYTITQGSPEVRCACESGDTTLQTWHCPKPIDPDCPAIRPRLGAPCSSSLTCNYGDCGAVPGGAAETCSGGIWVADTLVNCPQQ